MVGLHFILWLVCVSALPLLFIWSRRCRYAGFGKCVRHGQRIRSVTLVVLAGLMVWGPIRLLDVGAMR